VSHSIKKFSRKYAFIFTGYMI